MTKENSVVVCFEFLDSLPKAYQADLAIHLFDSEFGISNLAPPQRKYQQVRRKFVVQSHNRLFFNSLCLRLSAYLDDFFANFDERAEREHDKIMKLAETTTAISYDKITLLRESYAEQVSFWHKVEPTWLQIKNKYFDRSYRKIYVQKLVRHHQHVAELNGKLKNGYRAPTLA